MSSEAASSRPRSPEMGSKARPAKRRKTIHSPAAVLDGQNISSICLIYIDLLADGNNSCIERHH